MWGGVGGGRGIVNDVLCCVAKYLFDNAEGMPVKVGDVQVEMFDGVEEARLEFRVFANPVGQTFGKEDGGKIGVSKVSGDCDVVGRVVGFKEISVGVCIDVAVGVFIRVEVGEDPVE